MSSQLDGVCFTSVKEVNISLQDTNPFGRVASGEITLTGKLKQVVLDELPVHVYRHVSRRYVMKDMESRLAVGTAVMDSTNFENCFKDKALGEASEDNYDKAVLKWCVLIAKQEARFSSNPKRFTEWFAIILEPVTTSNDLRSFQRIGMFNLNNAWKDVASEDFWDRRNETWWDTYQSETIKLV
jgi:hypothetical protein